MTVPRPDAAPAGVPPLEHLYFYLTAGCNLACGHCWLAPERDPGGTRHAVLALELFVTAVREAKPLGLIGIKLTGGEPLLHPRFTELLAVVRQEGLALNLETNGLLCTPAVAAAIAECPEPFVAVSLDGAVAATHDAIRGVAGSFAQACRAIRELAADGLAPQVIMTVMRANASEVPELIHLSESLGAASVKFNLLQPTARGERLHEQGGALGVMELIDLGRRVELELSQTTDLEVLFDYPFAFRPLSRIARGLGHSACGIRGVLGVLATGDYALCGIGATVPGLVFGRVGADALAAVWQAHPILDALRAGLPTRLEGVCGRCLMRRDCLGTCVALNHYRTGSLFAPFWFCDQAEALGLFPLSRLQPAPRREANGARR